MASSTEPSNLTGAVTFWSYIVAAIFLSSFLAGTILSRPLASRQARRVNGIFVAFALLSFSTLSWNMLHVLIRSHDEWTRARRRTGFFGGGGDTSLQLWEWSTTSTLFRDFGDALVAHQATWAWSNAALGLTFLNMLYICAKGQRHDISRLWAFVALGEILPMSFAQNLFYLVLLRSPAVESGIPFASNLPWIIGGAGYAGCLVLAPHSGGYLIAVILLARALLVLPFLLRVDSRVELDADAADDQARAGASAAFWIFGPLTVTVGLLPILRAVETEGFAAMLAALDEHPAVSALGYDMMISCVSGIAWSFLRPSASGETDEEVQKVK